MAYVYFAKDDEVQHGPHKADWPLADCVQKLGLRQAHYYHLAEGQETPFFGN